MQGVSNEIIGEFYVDGCPGVFVDILLIHKTLLKGSMNDF